MLSRLFKKGPMALAGLSEELLDRLTTSLSEAERDKVSDSTWRGILGDARELSRHASDGGFRQMQALSKAMETCLESAQASGKLAKDTYENVFGCLELLTRIVAHLKAHEEEGHFQDEVEDRVSSLFEAHLNGVGGSYQLKKDTILQDEEVEHRRNTKKRSRG